MGLTADDLEREAETREQQARSLLEQARELRALAAQFRGNLRARSGVTPDMQAEHRVARARGMARRRQDPFLDAVVAAGMTLADLGRELGVSPTIFSMYRNRANPRPIPRARAEAVERLTGFSAAARNWPGGISG